MAYFFVFFFNKSCIKGFEKIGDLTKIFYGFWNQKNDKNVKKMEFYKKTINLVGRKTEKKRDKI